MRRLLPAVAALAALIVAPTAASAKEITSAKVCGADGCRTVTGSARLSGWADGGPPTSAPGKASGFYTIRLTIKAGGRREAFTVTYVPGLHRLRGSEGTWMSVPTEQAAIFARETAKLTPFPKERLRGLDTGGIPPARVVEVYSPADAAAAAHEGGGFPWAVIGIGLAGATLVLAAGVLMVRRRPHPTPDGRPRTGDPSVTSP